uniref:Uncharacterized protein n=1 Tax=Aegilops tauschii subsp. strangulata TaxID=200361 RepID=A0A452ZCN0_AEGTS
FEDQELEGSWAAGLAMPPPRASRPAGCNGGSMLRLLAVASLCFGCFVVGRWGSGVLRPDSGRTAGAAIYAGDLVSLIHLLVSSVL